jgi:hypothetical protein
VTFDGKTGEGDSSSATKLGQEDKGAKEEVLHEHWREENWGKKKGGASMVTDPFKWSRWHRVTWRGSARRVPGGAEKGVRYGTLERGGGGGARSQQDSWPVEVGGSRRDAHYCAM